MAALLIAVGGVWLLTDVRLGGEPIGFVLAFANCVLFMLYVSLGHRIATRSTDGASRWNGVDQLGAAMIVATVVAAPIGVPAALPVFHDLLLLLAGIGVWRLLLGESPMSPTNSPWPGSVGPRSPLMLSILPALATVIGLVVLAQRPAAADLVGVALVIAGIAVHQEIHGDIRGHARSDSDQKKLQEGNPCST